MNNWFTYKQRAWERVIRDKEIGYLDPDIFDTLEVFFKRRDTFTQSSCSGRITIIDAEMPWERKNSSVVFKNHLGITVTDLLETINKGKVWNLWLVVQGPIFHVYTRTNEEAWDILKLARSVGFKHSGVLTVNEKGVLVELRTGVKMVHLLKDNYDEKEANELVVIANKVLQKGKEKLRKLKEVVENSLNSNNSMELRKNSEGNSEFQYNINKLS
ncbi:tRNA(Phe) 7-((3-amino-3-carboxypropyl)-4-demethylwyosine(37)-N(4))-methyltransferase [Sulfurisphaera ohwakuensis]|uniref:tRNA(Phe) 7-((3-amino-3-carboxypropyl)-4-demethylwyosine(37)-N(4))-methyltransferase n=1 Tax=Sulfurisphaera ohwakuensis TaxID=69656 RepID=A0A650CHG1_SULOH|nr:hypothetical protein [Sulfurisphaera ohwakuensis]MBB5252339.1 tRNA wybutosine-synthesizing protein 3 [Sulfurisphaera ohwakuensis]QGR17199.1 hypothetical protein D1869_08365 [Sulfurisphaera ohwakuensis]